MKYPFIPIVLGLITGILLYFHFEINLAIVVFSLVISLILLVFTYYKKLDQWFVIVLFFVFLFSGFVISNTKDSKNNQKHYTKNKIFNSEKNISFLIEIQQELKPSSKYFRYIAEVKSINQLNVEGKMLFCVQKNLAKKPKIGYQILVFNTIKSVPTPKNKFQFDYQKFLYYKDVLGQCYAKSEQIKILNYQNNLLSKSNELRTQIIKSFEKQGISYQSLAIIKALLLGEKQDIDKDQYQNYSKSGAVHVLAISGLHIGIILMFLLFVFKPLQKLKHGNLIISLCILLILWSFAFISGLSASVVRAVTMYSFVAIAIFIHKKTLIINTLLVSLFVLLIIHPKYVFDVGFQLSYLAVFAIVYIQPILKKYYQPKTLVSRYFYDILTVSIAAQLGVMPLSIYYFHQFPGLFFLTNLLIIPLVTGILFLGFCSILICFFIDIPSIFVKILDFFVMMMNLIVTKIASFENFVLSNIYSSLLLMIITTILVFSFFNFLKNKTFLQLKTVLYLSIFGFLTYFSTQFYSYFQQETLIFYHNKELIILDKKGFQLNCFTNQKLDKNQDLENYQREYFISKNHFFKLKNFESINNKKILIIDKTLLFNQNIKPDVLILHNNPKINLERILENVQPKKVIFTPKNYKNNVLIWKKILTQKKINFHNMYENGFVEL